ncbi:PucR family transcriptional regulator [Parasporobacterium paucivorans]|uniref:PucR C-terminal helix-turn-helix domain-containing protein n=1 Tax=Parasporobacterium paucivorans DSM 15970 TaxID=1122934 RepID=A0A1M6LMG9_9FIRM|nr:helix-turn-helix domain-containing protein [Parasporobacterium paucivorans]SHJ72409.1 PucR C-terminal helix-turn-helix domain-containing protein [Parasporobacterium paucivorans DSM 15970]
MKLSMWILADWLQKYEPVLHIKDGAPTLRGVRIFSTELTIETQNVYLGLARDFIPTGSGEVICVHGHDMILLQTTDLEAVLNDVFDAFDYYNRWSDSIKESIFSGCPVLQITENSQDIIDDPFVVFDSGNMLIAHSTRFGLGSFDEEWDRMILNKSNSLEKLYFLSEYFKSANFSNLVQASKLSAFQNKSMWRNLYLKNRFVGRVVIIEKNHPITNGRMHLCDELGHLIEIWMSHNQAQHEIRENHKIFLDLLDNEPISEEELLHRLKVQSWLPSAPKMVIAVNTLLSHEEMLNPLIRKLERSFSSCFVFEYKSSILLFVNLSVVSYFTLSQLLPPILKQSRSYCGASYEFTNIMDLKSHYEQCKIAIDYGNKLPGSIYHCKDYALKYFYSVMKGHINQNIIPPELISLQKHDAQYQSDLFMTLHQFLLNERNLVKTAHCLSIHRNTLIYRLNKIKEMINLDLDDAENRELLLLSYKLIQVNG